MIKAGGSWKYRVKYVKHRRYQDGNITSFSIGDKIKDGDGYQNWQFTVWDYVDLNDGDSINIKTIDTVQTTQYNGKNHMNMSGTVEVIQQQKQGFAEEEPPQVSSQYKRPDTAPQQTGFIDDPDVKLPFDI